MLDELAVLAVDQPLGAAEPAPRASHLALPREGDPDPERAARREQVGAGVEMRPMPAFEGRAVGVVVAAM